ncbi:N-acetylglucosamine-6-phosphate deacetylase [Parahaliea maris]|uniref:N-acetylglucosamine-6-phosphate deacetylase n=1 Tax=Parahaliea maris TaxID=2716870 RepID=A0A5C8ZQ51_9GAMM|nr:N-acetylglucosamine-6-phosphate deacetylase [Parahaliea maris]TXS89812.1 N-acetylglucosamine-6-phosphate deacetylase [Parahaliea maris]
MSQTLRARRLFDGEQWREDCAVLIQQGLIDAILPAAELPPGTETIDLEDGLLAPGFIDIQVNGGGGVLFNNQPDAAGVERMVAAHRATGTTALLPTLISDTPAVHRAGVQAVLSAQGAGNPGVLGIHIEGPFFEVARRGTHRKDRIRQPEQHDIDWLASLGTQLSTVLTAAPEHLPPGTIAALTAAGVLVCAGHTNASYQQIVAARAEGLRGFTHLFNAMSPLTAREPGVVGAALDAPDCWVGIIADGHHVHPASIRIAHRTLPPGRLCLVTDAMSTVGDDKDWFEIYGERIQVREGRLVNAEGALAGSAIGMIDAVRYCHQQVGIELAECLRMASLYPATFLRREQQLGRIAPGFRADFVRLDDNLQVLDTWVAGARETHRSN